MGKRKERRLAAMSNAGRRVKLDLCTEPSGELGASEMREEVGGDLKDSAESPNSPASVGQQTQNPLLLLGQYSDDEPDEELNETCTHAILGCSSSDTTKGQVEEPREEECKDLDVQAGANIMASKVEQVNTAKDSVPPPKLNFKQEDNGARNSEATAQHMSKEQVEYVAQISVAASSEVQVIGDVGPGWKMVLHRGSNQYYYWNTETGETSWDAPEVLSQVTGSTSDQKTMGAGCPEDGSIGLCESRPVLTAESVNARDKEINAPASSSSTSCCTAYNTGAQMAEWLEGYRSQTIKNESGVADPSASATTSQIDLHALNAPVNQEGSTDPGNSSDDVPENGAGKDISARLVSQAESLLEKLRSLQCSQGNLESLDWISRYAVEIEVRLSDIKALISCGSALLPLWEHSYMQLKRLEDVIDNRIYQLARSAVLEEVAVANISSFGKTEKSPEHLGDRVDMGDHGENFDHSSDMSHACANEARDENGGSPSGPLESSVAGSEAHVVPAEVVPEPGFHVVDDVDMDVDMDVEDAIVEDEAANLKVSCCNNFETTEQSNTTMKEPAASYNDMPAFPPPPDEEWIPPPPPDDEYIPPPPPDDEYIPPPPPDDDELVPPPPLPDEFHELSYPPPPSYSGQSVSYTEQYNLTCPDPSYQYLGNVAAAVSSGPLYGHEVQGTLPHVSFYYGTVPGASSEVAPAMVNAIDPVGYYNLNKPTIPPLPVPANLESSLQSESALAGAIPGIDVSVSNGENKMASSEVASASTVMGATATVSLKDSASQLAQSADILTAKVAGASTSTKTESKVVRTKKRALTAASSLRSKKRVSSLVDKWKAAKEELNESEEDEPKTAYEIFEKKRQKEIEEWYAKQIASGDAKDNANFQPLGGDWRERVKQKRAKAAREASKAEAESNINENQWAGLVEASKDLPPGWQAYWDDSSKQVYYGNKITSESSWTKPKK